MSFGWGMALSYSWKHQIMTKSLMEAELVGVDDSLGHILWTKYFMQAQGYEMEALLLYQDNMSPMLLEMNGKASSSKHTKHIKVIRLTEATLSSSTARPSRCGLISTQNQSRVWFFVSPGDI